MSNIDWANLLIVLMIFLRLNCYHLKNLLIFLSHRENVSQFNEIIYTNWISDFVIICPFPTLFTGELLTEIKIPRQFQKGNYKKVTSFKSLSALMEAFVLGHKPLRDNFQNCFEIALLSNYIPNLIERSHNAPISIPPSHLVNCFWKSKTTTWMSCQFGVVQLILTGPVSATADFRYLVSYSICFFFL